MTAEDLISDIKDNGFLDLALRFYKHQSKYNAVYRRYLELSGQMGKKVKSLDDIPFLPISFFKTNVVKTGQWRSVKKFYSSTTSGQEPSIHYIKDIALYEGIARSSFASCIGKDPEDFTWIGLLPSYLERGNSSLTYMVQYFMDHAKGQQESYFFLNEYDRLFELLQTLKKQNKQAILIGVTFALLDFAEKYKGNFENLIVIETGGMKGRGKEPTRSEVHQSILKNIRPGAMGSEYGMTELMSQSYLLDGDYFKPASSMKVLPRDITDPLASGTYGKNSCLNIIDLGNVHSCCFIATDDVGIVERDGKFKVLGRLDYSDVRGCSLMFT